MRPSHLLSGRLKPGAVLAGLVGFVLLVCVALVAATGWQIKQSANERIANAEVAVSNIVRAAEQQAQDTIHQAANTLADLAERIEVDGTGAAQNVRLARLMRRQVQTIEGLQGLFIYNENGDWLATSFSEQPALLNNSDRAYFVFHREHPGSAIRIGSIILSRTTGDPVIPVSRRLQYPDGRFAGVALATLPVAYFQRFFERLEVDDKGVIFLALNNGDLLARRPLIENLMTTNIAKGDIFTRYLPQADHGTAIITSVVDGIERVYAYRSLEGLPLVTAAGLSREFVLAQWHEYARRSLAIVGLICLALSLLGWLLYLQIRRGLEAEQQLTHAHQSLEVLAQTDSLTGLANRRYFDTALEKELARARRNSSPLAVILMDIDWFKQYNDHYGHVHGDAALRHVAKLLGVNVNRPTDVAARYGGEEFVVLLPETDLAGARNVAEKIRHALFDSQYAHAGSPLGVLTLSAGVSELASTHDLLESADQRLYRAKQQGRNGIDAG
ncbi:diguanylate cyclase [Pseudomonas sp. nanlin1]|uniref:sensor domain-containing diguanylate cyclase n=1 Tax=Pseudomonas sp. nanlin1 TaxID=3040605 RepID=UPI00388F41F6